MDIRIINYFISVYEERSFTKAAEKVHVVQSALSMQIRNLEDELGASLFERNARGVEPTVAGRRFYELCVPIARDITTAKQEIVDLVHGKRISGSLRIGLPSSICKGILGSVLAEFCEEYPFVDLTVMESYHRILTEHVQAGVLDVALAAMPAEHHGLAFHPSFQDTCVLVSGRPINGDPFTPCDLSLKKDLDLIIPSERHLLGQAMNNYIATGQISPRRLMRIDGTIAVMESVLNSDWGSVCPMSAVINDVDSGRFFIYPVVNPDIKFDLHLVHDQRRPLTLAARCFVDILEKKLADVYVRWSKVTGPGKRAALKRSGANLINDQTAESGCAA